MLLRTSRTALLSARQAVKPHTMSLGRRTFATQSEGSNTGTKHFLLTAATAAGLGGAYYYYSQQNKGVDYQAVYNDIAALLEDENWDDGSWGPQFLRNAWHTSGTYDKISKTGGSFAGTIRFADEGGHGANAGLEKTRERLEPIFAKYPGLSHGDLYTLAGVVAVKEMGGPDIKWRPGREDGGPEKQTPDGRLPDGDKGPDHVHDIFGRLGFNEQETVALIGAHALGRCHPQFSGFEGPWTFSPTTFSNQYFALLDDEKWNKGKSSAGNPQYWNKDKSLMMLFADYALIQDPEYRKYVKIYKDDEERFFKDFAAAVGKLFELGIPESALGSVQSFESPE